MEEPTFFDWYVGIGYWDEVEYFDMLGPWYIPNDLTFDGFDAINE
jgi:hypothetical protein